MNNDVLIGITQTLSSIKDCPIHVDNVEQKFETPCFLVTPLNISDTRLLDNVYQRNYLIMIQYFSNNKDYHMEYNDISELLVEKLQMLKTNKGLLPAYGEIKTSVVDGVLNCEVKYRPHITRSKETSEEKMNNLTLTFVGKEQEDADS